MTDPIRAELQALIDSAEHVSPYRGHESAWDAALDRAREALAAQPAPVPELTEQIMALMPQQMHADLAAAVRGWGENLPTAAKGAARVILNRHVVDLVRAAIAADRAALAAQPAPVTPPADGEAEELAQWLEDAADDVDDYYKGSSWPPANLRRAAALLREARPQPVPVAERPWEREGWCDAEGRCWIRSQRPTRGWRLMDPTCVPQPCYANLFDFALPHWAIPTPTKPTPTTEHTNAN